MILKKYIVKENINKLNFTKGQEIFIEIKNYVDFEYDRLNRNIIANGMYNVKDFSAPIMWAKDTFKVFFSREDRNIFSDAEQKAIQNWINIEIKNDKNYEYAKKM